MTIPAPFAAVNVDWNRSTEMALLLEAVAGYAVLNYGPNFPGSGSTPTGLANDATVYTATVNIDGTNRAVSIVGSAAQTFTALVAEIDTDLSTWATTALVGNTIVITSKAFGPGKNVVVTDSGTNHLFASVHGNYFGLVSNQNYKGNNRYLRWDKIDGIVQSDVDFAIDAFLAAAAANTNTKWASGYDAITVGATLIDDDTSLNLDTAWDINVDVDGVGAVNVVLNLRIPQKPAFASFGLVVEALQAALVTQGVPATASFVPGAPSQIRVTANSVGTSSSVALTAGTSHDLIAALGAGAFVGVAGVDGATNASFPSVKAGVTWASWDQVLQNWKSPTGFGALFSSGSGAVFEREDKPASKGTAVRTAVYWSGAVWKYFDSDVTLDDGTAVNPPEA